MDPCVYDPERTQGWSGMVWDVNGIETILDVAGLNPSFRPVPPSLPHDQVRLLQGVENSVTGP